MTQMICDTIRWLRAAPDIRSVVFKTALTLAAQEEPTTSPFAQRASLTASDDESDSRGHRPQIPSREECEGRSSQAPRGCATVGDFL